MKREPSKPRLALITPVLKNRKLEITKASYFLNKVDSQMQLRIKEVIRLATENSMVRSRSPKSIVLTNMTLVQR
jgi:hypothetical protein